MKSLKKIISSLLLLVVACQFAPVQAEKGVNLPVYQNSIKDISLGYEDSSLAGSIKLDNGLIFHIVDYKTRDDNVMNTWRPHDVVNFKAHVKHDALILAATRVACPNKDVVEPYLIFDVINSPKSGLIVVEITDEGKFVRLNDNSVWEFSWFNRFSTKHWSPGERVLVFGQGKKNSYEFINLDSPVAKNASTAEAAFVVH